MRHATLIMSLLLASLAASFTGCATTNAARTSKANYGDGVKVSGVITYRERIALPGDAVVTARLVDVSTPDKPVVLSEQVISKPGQVPVPFVLTAAADRIDQNQSYAIEASISVGRQVRWRNTQQYGVITRGNPFNGLMVWVQQID